MWWFIYYELYNYTELPEPNPENFIDYNDITEETVISWLESLLDIDINNQLVEQGINEKLNPPIIQGIPWDNN